MQGYRRFPWSYFLHHFLPACVPQGKVLRLGMDFPNPGKPLIHGPIDGFHCGWDGGWMKGYKGGKAIRISMNQLCVEPILDLAGFLILPVPALKNHPFHLSNIHVPQGLFDRWPSLQTGSEGWGDTIPPDAFAVLCGPTDGVAGHGLGEEVDMGIENGHCGCGERFPNHPPLIFTGWRFW